MHHYQSARYTIYFNPDILSLCLIKLTEKIKKKIDFLQRITIMAIFVHNLQLFSLQSSMLKNYTNGHQKFSILVNGFMRSDG